MELGGLKSPKSFWERPEGTTGMIVGAALICAALLGLYWVLPFIITLLQNALYASLLFVAVAVVGMVLTDKKFWTLLFYGYKSVMRWFTGWFVTIDPIGILNTYVETLKNKLGVMDEQLENLKGQIGTLRNIIKKNASQALDALKLSKEARDKKRPAVFVLKSREAGRLKESNVRLEDVLTKMEILYRVLSKMREASSFLIGDIESQVQVATQERSAMRASYRAMKMAQRIIQGDKDRELFDQTMEFLAEDYGRKLGEIERFVEMSSNFLDSVDLKNGVYEADAMKMLEDWEKKGDSILLGDSKSTLIAEAYDPEQVLDLDMASPAVSGARVDTDYKKLFR